MKRQFRDWDKLYAQYKQTNLSVKEVTPSPKGSLINKHLDELPKITVDAGKFIKV